MTPSQTYMLIYAGQLKVEGNNAACKLYPLRMQYVPDGFTY